MNFQENEQIMDRDQQLCQARQLFGQGRRISWETSVFEGTHQQHQLLSILCTFGGRLIDSVRFRNCTFKGMPLAELASGNIFLGRTKPFESLAPDDNFFGHLALAARFGRPTCKMVANIVFEFAEPKRMPAAYLDMEVRWTERKGKQVFRTTIHNVCNSRVRYKLVLVGAGEGNDHHHLLCFNKFMLVRCGLKQSVKRGWARLRALFGGTDMGRGQMLNVATTMVAGRGQDTEKKTDEDEQMLQAAAAGHNEEANAAAGDHGEEEEVMYVAEMDETLEGSESDEVELLHGADHQHQPRMIRRPPFIPEGYERVVEEVDSKIANLNLAASN